ncbi:TPA: ribonuclease J [Candidatus Poribacteria bacterium]|nr:ribonuclease J [Candidatus Poribacteria bacterium]
MNKENYLSIIPLGGLGEFGMNMMLFEYRDDIVIIDAGMMFPHQDMYGVDLVVPDITYLLQNREKVRAVVLTHGHEDHIGGLPYLLQQLNVPIYGTKLTMSLVSNRLREFNLLSEVELHEITPRDRIQLGVFDFEFIHVSHSIPDTVGLAIHTPVGVVIHSGDFKLDQTPVDGKVLDFHKLTEFGDKGVLLLLLDSTNAERAGYSGSERDIFPHLEQIFQSAKQRLFLSTFASSIHRIQQFIELAYKYHRYIAVSGRSMVSNIRVAQEFGYLWVPDDIMIDVKDVMYCPPHECMVLTTGSQGEPLSALSLMAVDDHAWMRIEAGDTVVISARIIPGHERDVDHIVDHLFRRGAIVIYERTAKVHVSGHGSQEDLKLMMNLVRPKFFMPVHGEYRHLVYNARLAEKTGIHQENIIIAEDGDRIQLTPESCENIGGIKTGWVFVDGKTIGELEGVVLRDRRQLAEDGFVIPIVVLNSQTGELVAEPDIVSRGFIYIDESEKLMNEAKELTKFVLDKLNIEEKSASTIVQEELRTTLRRFFRKNTDRRPIIIPVVMRC